MILADTGVLLAAANDNESAHQACLSLLEEHAGGVLVSPLVIDETCYMLGSRLGPKAEALFLESFVEGTLLISQLRPSDLGRMAALIRKYADLHIGAADASVVALAERLEITEVATLDRRHFSVVRPSHCDAFRILPD